MPTSPHATLVIVLLVAATASVTLGASTPEDGAVYHIRTTDLRLRTLITDGVRGSPTFRALVDRLVASDVVVYLRSEEALPSRADGRLAFIAAAGGYRYVVVRLRPMRSRAHQIALLGHELRHAVEIADAPLVVDTASLAREYERIGYASRLAEQDRITFDTDAAIAAGYQVLAELGVHRKERRRPRMVSVDSEEASARWGAGGY
jgi:hypothetical protein